jgi:hypothetical protein
MAAQSEMYENIKMAREGALLGDYETSQVNDCLLFFYCVTHCHQKGCACIKLLSTLAFKKYGAVHTSQSIVKRFHF